MAVLSLTEEEKGKIKKRLTEISSIFDEADADIEHDYAKSILEVSQDMIEDLYSDLGDLQLWKKGLLSKRGNL